MSDVVCAWCLSEEIEVIDHEHAIYRCQRCGEIFSRPVTIPEPGNEVHGGGSGYISGCDTLPIAQDEGGGGREIPEFIGVVHGDPGKDFDPLL